LFEKFMDRIRVPAVPGCPRSPEALAPFRGKAAVEARFSVSLRADDVKSRGGVDDVPWLTLQHDERCCDVCELRHDFRIGPRFTQARRVLLIAIEGATPPTAKVWTPLSFTALIHDRLPVDDHLASFVRMIDYGDGTRHFVAFVHRNKRCKTWTCYDDEAVSPATPLKIEDGWLRDTVRLTFYVAAG
jgi:hypothetical protein